MKNAMTEEITKKLGFGCMRLPVTDGVSEHIDDAAFCKMIDTYLERGFNYFDTAFPYHNQKSEEAVRRCLVERYPREKFLLADKMPVWLVKEYADFEKYFQMQLERCGVEYFDFYLLHAMGKERMKEMEERGAFEFLAKMKAEGRIRHAGFSFHDTADVLDEILTNHPEFEFVQLQINYYDWDSDSVQSGKCYEVAVKHHIPVIVMEPVKGGTLSNLIGKPADVLKAQNEKASYASYAVRFAASLDNVMVVLSGMSNEEQLEDNTSYMEQFKPLNDTEQQAIREVVEELGKLPTIACTKCRYCVDGCPQKILIPDQFEAYNLMIQFGDTPAMRQSYKWAVGEPEHGKASACIRCGKCEKQCPQHLPIRELLAKMAEVYEK